MTRPPEIVVQQAIIAAIEAAVHPVDVRAIPNASTSLSKAMRGKLKREGRKAGTPDLLVCWPGGCGFIEVKRPAARGGHRPSDVSEEQLELIERWQNWRVNVAIVTTPKDALAILELWGAPVRGRVAA